MTTSLPRGEAVSVPLLTADDAEALLRSSRAERIEKTRPALEAIASGAAVVVPATREGAEAGESATTSVTATVPPIQAECLSDDFGDPLTLYNSRQWLQSAVEAKGAKVTGAGVGGCQADIDVTLEGCEFNISIKPRIRNKAGPVPSGTPLRVRSQSESAESSGASSDPPAAGGGEPNKGGDAHAPGDAAHRQSSTGLQAVAGAAHPNNADGSGERTSEQREAERGTTRIHIHATLDFGNGDVRRDKCRICGWPDAAISEQAEGEVLIGFLDDRRAGQQKDNGEGK